MSKTSAIVDSMVMLLDEAFESLLETNDYHSFSRSDDEKPDEFLRRVEAFTAVCNGYMRTYVDKTTLARQSSDDPLRQRFSYARVWPGLGVFMKLRGSYMRISGHL